MQIIFCQFSNQLLNPNNKDLAYKYYNDIYKIKTGYWKNEHYFELPLWIAEICGALKYSTIETQLHIITDIEQSMKYLKQYQNKNTLILFSALDVNKHFIKIIAKLLPFLNIHIGGYINFEYFNSFKNIKIHFNIKSFIESLGIEYIYNLDYSLFKNEKTIPRLTLSKGCLNKCDFCTVEKTITAISEENIFKQVMSFQNLNFMYIYLNDKTYGQANNFTILYDIFDIVKEYNPKFKGFIIQTTAMEIISNEKLQVMLRSNIIYAVEFGMETYNNDILYSLNKPQNEKTIILAMDIIKYFKVKCIPNIIIGFLQENRLSYNRTLNFLNHYKNDLFILNIYNLAIYEDSKLHNEIIAKDKIDFNENSLEKTFYTNKQKKDNKYFYNQIFKLALKTL